MTTPIVTSPPPEKAERHFLEEHFQSLEKIDEEILGGRKLNALNSRLSISARYHEKSKQ